MFPDNYEVEGQMSFGDLENQNENTEEKIRSDYMSYWDNICDIQRKQTEKGIATYGQRLEDNAELSIEERITMFEEEMIDALMYAEHLKAELRKDDKYE